MIILRAKNLDEMIKILVTLLMKYNYGYTQQYDISDLTI